MNICLTEPNNLLPSRQLPTTTLQGSKRHRLKTATLALALSGLLLNGCGGSDLPLNMDEASGQTSTTDGAVTTANNTANSGSTNTGSTTPDQATSGNPSVTTSTPANGLILNKQSAFTEAPAKVSVAFNVETDQGQPVTGLTLDNFALYENDELISAFESQPKITPDDGDFTYSTMLLLDFSSSVVSTALTELKEAATLFVDHIFSAQGINASHELAVALFDGQQNIVYVTDYLTNPLEIKDRISLLDESNMIDPSTNLYGAVQQGIESIEQRLSDNMILDSDLVVAGAMVLFTDGRDQAARVSEQNALNTVAQTADNISLYTIGLGSDIDSDVLTAVGVDGFQQAVSLDALVSSFTSVASNVANEANSYYTLEYCTPKRAGNAHILRIVATQSELQGELSISFSAEGFSSECEL